MIELKNITKRFGAKVAVDNLHLEIEAGELFAILGPNGAGKTTTIKMITGLLRPDEGCIRVCGKDVLTEPVAAKQHISYIPDEPYLYEKLSGREFLEFVGSMYRMERKNIEKEVVGLSECLGLGDFIDDLSEQYSHGMKQRVVIASALLHDPKVIVVDEPMVGLDPKSARVVKDLLSSLAKNGTTIFMSTHTLAVAEELADRIGIMAHGRMIALGTLHELQRLSCGERGLEESYLRITAEEEPA